MIRNVYDASFRSLAIGRVLASFFFERFGTGYDTALTLRARWRR